MDTTVTKNDGREYPVPNKDTVYKDKYQEPKLNRHQRRAVNKMRDKAMEQQRKMKRRQNNV